MTNHIKIFSLTLMTVLAVNAFAQNTESVWSEAFEKKHLQNREDSTTWDVKLFKEDLKSRDAINGLGLPMTYGVFPVPNYDLAGKFKFAGTGYSSYWKNCSGKKIVYSTFNMGKNSGNAELLGDKKNETFFTIMVLTDFIDSIKYTHQKNHILSRNNPDVAAQGYIKTKDNKVDYSAFITASRAQYAFVNMRLFNLEHGRFILIAPQKDGSFRSLQLSSPILSSDEVSPYMNKMLKQENVIQFFTNEGNI